MDKRVSALDKACLLKKKRTSEELIRCKFGTVEQEFDQIKRTNFALSVSAFSFNVWMNFGGMQSSAIARARKLPSTVSASGVSRMRSGKFFIRASNARREQKSS